MTTASAAMTSTTTSVSMRCPGSGVGGFHVQSQPVDVADERLGSGLDRPVVDVARSPGRTPVVDAAGLSGLETDGHADPITSRDGSLDLATAAAHDLVDPPAERDHRDDR